MAPLTEDQIDFLRSQIGDAYDRYESDPAIKQSAELAARSTGAVTIRERLCALRAAIMALHLASLAVEAMLAEAKAAPADKRVADAAADAKKAGYIEGLKVAHEELVDHYGQMTRLGHGAAYAKAGFRSAMRVVHTLREQAEPDDDAL